MKCSLILIVLSCGILALIPPQALAQTDDPLVEANRLNDTCTQFYNAGKYNEAIEPCQRALVILENALGDENITVALVLNNFALMYHSKAEV